MGIISGGGGGGTFNGGTITKPLDINPTNPAPVGNNFLGITAPAGTQTAGPFLIEVVDENGSDQLTLDSYGSFLFSSPLGSGNRARFLIAQRVAGGGTVDLVSSGGPLVGVNAANGQTDAMMYLAYNSQPVLVVGNGVTIGFFGATPAARPTGVAVTAAAIHAALVTLGLITA